MWCDESYDAVTVVRLERAKRFSQLSPNDQGSGIIDISDQLFYGNVHTHMHKRKDARVDANML